MITPVFKGEGKYASPAYMEFDGGKVRFDCSDEEYGPIEFDINILIDTLYKHQKSWMEEIIKSQTK